MAKLFFSYSHRDGDLRDELEIHLATLKREGVIETWHDRRIGAGKEFGNEISQHLEKANIILLLISPYFIASDYHTHWGHWWGHWGHIGVIGVRTLDS